MGPSNQIIRFFDHQYLWKDSIDRVFLILINFLHGDSHYKKVAPKGVVKCAKPRPNVPRLARVALVIKDYVISNKTKVCSAI